MSTIYTDDQLLENAILFIMTHDAELIAAYSSVFEEKLGPEQAAIEATDNVNALIRRLNNIPMSIKRLREKVNLAISSGGKIEDYIANSTQLLEAFKYFLSEANSEELNDQVRDYLIRRAQLITNHYISNLRLIAINKIIDDINSDF